MRQSIGNKIRFIAFLAAIPFVLICIYLLGSLLNYGDAYDRIVSNMAIANNYNLNFKEDMDESLYKLVVGYTDFAHIADDGTIKDPYVMLDELRSEFTKLKDVTTEQESRMWLESLLRNIDSLEHTVDDIRESLETDGRYLQNIEKLDNTVYILTELIQDDIQNYIYYQIKDMDRINKALNQEIRRFFRVCVVGVLVVCLIVLVLTVLLTSNFLKPVKELYLATEQIAKGNFSARAVVDSGDEIEVLADKFNGMAENMEAMIEQIKTDERKMRQADLRLLQEQINPHFLYNTLDTIVWLVEADEPQQAVDMVVTLSGFFRLVLSKGKEFISIREEEQHVRSYLEIQKVRYHDILEYEINIDKVLYDYQILKLTLQPLVENALYHGIKYKRAKGRIYISGEKEDQRIILTVQDNGVGMEPEELAQLQKEIERPCQETEKGYGLANVNERIKINYGPEYGITIESGKGRGTRVTVTLPAVACQREVDA